MTITTNGKEPKSYTFDEPQLILVKKCKSPTRVISRKKVGGPAKYMDEGRP